MQREILRFINNNNSIIFKYTYFKTSDNKLWAHGLTMDEIVERIKPNTDVIGITNMFLHKWEFIYKILKYRY